MEKLVGQEQCDPSYVAAYVKMLLDNEQLVDAALLLERLEKVGKPGSAVRFAPSGCSAARPGVRLQVSSPRT